MSNFFDDYTIRPENRPTFSGNGLATAGNFNNGFMNPHGFLRRAGGRNINAFFKELGEHYEYLLSDLGFGIFGAGQDWRPVRVLG